MARIRIFRDGRPVFETDGAVGETVYDLLRRAGPFLDAPCGGRGVCGKCLVRLSPEGEPVRACRTRITGEMEVFLADQQEMQIAGAEEVTVRRSSGGPLGAAVDVGTTTLVARLYDLSSGTVLGTAAAVNQQRRFGADVISRIQCCADRGHEALTRSVLEQTAELVASLCAQCGGLPENVTRMAVAGNTVMEHLFANLSPVSLGHAPFQAESLFGETRPAPRELGLSPAAEIYYTPAVAAYVGGDITAGMLAVGMKDSCLYLDVGTNGEMTIQQDGKIYCCATAAGPAFEGAEITCGMSAASGAIDRVEWKNGKLECSVLGGGTARGICGSGLIDALAVMLAMGAVDETGRLLDEDEAPAAVLPFLTERDGAQAFSLAGDVYITAGDVRKLQLAKAAVAAGSSVLLRRSGAGTVSSLLLAGGFGSYIRPESAAAIGLIPRQLLPVTRAVGNTALEGAALALLSPERRREMEDLRRRCVHIELAEDPDFMDEFVERMCFEDDGEDD